MHALNISRIPTIPNGIEIPSPNPMENSSPWWIDEFSGGISVVVNNESDELSIEICVVVNDEFDELSGVILRNGAAKSGATTTPAE